MPDIFLSEEQITLSTDRDLLEKHRAQLLRSGTEPGWIESYWVHRTSFQDHRYRQQYWRQVYRNDRGQLFAPAATCRIRKHIPVGQVQEYRQWVANRKQVEQIERRLQELEGAATITFPQKTPI